MGQVDLFDRRVVRTDDVFFEAFNRVVIDEVVTQVEVEDRLGRLEQLSQDLGAELGKSYLPSLILL